eukprot:CAMPEP_0194510886 /NCGR_PEP_ID=MMETSP0253-20130528/42369_1 /TAXON_ID=2966 /ORGANISM="Noctiluca scintillans" /LENGTH=58 /DNA_ID=CAMNT_0039354167 /DNA_START=235 /DNA_END=411 /DNA_ORIENTATION=-
MTSLPVPTESRAVDVVAEAMEGEPRRPFQGKDVDKIWTFERKQVLAILRNLEYSKADV